MSRAVYWRLRGLGRFLASSMLYAFSATAAATLAEISRMRARGGKMAPTARSFSDTVSDRASAAAKNISSRTATQSARRIPRATPG
eukprot:7169246-Pyramimonas_sp.AAC.1